MDIIFMGTPDFAVKSLDSLIKAGHNVKAVFTQPDKPKGRGHKLQPTPVKELALLNGITVYQPKTLKNPEMTELIKSLAPEVIVVVAYGKILPKAILELPTYGCVNVHGSLLPRYRGAAPIQWSIIDDNDVTGITTMYMAEGVDTGDMILTEQTAIGENETASELFDRLGDIGAKLIVTTLDRIKDGTAPRIPQDEQLSSHAPMLTKEMGNIDFTKPARKIHKLICGLSSWPLAYTTLEGKRLKVYNSQIITDCIDCDNQGFEVGQLVDQKRFIVKCIDGYVEFTKVQYDNGKPMDARDFLRGKRFASQRVIVGSI